MVRNGIELLTYLDQSCGQGSKEHTPPDIILLDLNMPRKDGREALREIRAMKTSSAIPIVVFSTSDNVTDIKDCYEAGCNSYVTKPPELDDFFAALQQIASYWLELSALP